ncbi:MAG: S24 family peptidase [Proteobacteria bacterium]|nr:S24 family peptidase [Pseudomonadota bacterium]
MKSPDPRARLVELAAAQGTSLAALSAYLGRNPAYLQQFVRKGSPRKLEEGDRRRLARFLGVDEAELGGAEEISPGLARSALALRGDWVEVPRLALGASAGPGALAGDEAMVGAFRFSAAWLRGQGLDPALLSAIAVAGDSMEPTLRDGDEILVDRRPRGWRDGVHVVRCHEALLVKRVDLSAPGRVTLRSDNPAYPPLELGPDEVDLVGKVVWKSGRL